ncbi:MAG: hypothetical protein IJ326_12830 [Lachnospiraceae bacterium]|nr:hypothetical protein [Lachnospiraceae bacterium]
MKVVKEYLLSVCVVYTILSLVKIFMEGISSYQDPYYVMNFGMMFVVTCFATFVLFMHRIFDKVPLVFVMIGQYIVVIGGVMLGLFVMSKLVEVSPNAYRELFLQITVPYIVLAGIYYVSYFNEVRRANHNLSELKKMENRNDN